MSRFSTSIHQFFSFQFILSITTLTQNGMEDESKITNFNHIAATENMKCEIWWYTNYLLLFCI